ncbi:hypothetical protein [Paenibacillus polymyxa]|uniref:hypothetical protein n=1 Tax=Paenibacillus polymyxa TaxID=1406 RepID=UPI0003D2A5D6|nr:hypothetical protein [Paenibacillus polymyxa]AIW40963.1 hypothetical protein X809_33720 [Paenibacillus polymyxa CR1]ODB57339.1 hypothetical protein A7309_05995 [Paenibacillus polymyxa]
MYISSREIKEKMTRKFETQYPDLLLYLDNPYISELLDAILDVVSQEVSELKNEVLLKKDISRRL